MKRTFVVVMSVVIVLACIRFGFLVKSENFSVITPLKTGESYRILYEEKIPREKLSLFTVNEKLIVLFFDYEGIINIYSIDGEFLYGFQIESLKKERVTSHFTTIDYLLRLVGEECTSSMVM